MKKLISLLLAFAVCLSMLSVPAFAADTWDGTPADGFAITATGADADNAIIISTAAELAYLSSLINGAETSSWNTKYYKLGADIDLNNMAWTPIGSVKEKPFKGNFDGAGHVIKNLNVTLTSTLKTSGLFGFIDGATIKNVGINGATVATESGLEYDGVSTNRWIAGVLIGAVVDQSTGNVISDCYIKNANMNLTITTSSSASDLTPLESAGTIVGCSYTSKASTAKVSNCYTVNATITGSNGAGGSLKVKTAATGLIGATAQKWTIENCYAADVEITGFGNIANLIRSETGSNKPTITNCYSCNVTQGYKSYTEDIVKTVTANDLEAVPSGLAGSFVADTENGYPVLKWEVTSDDEDDNTEPDDEIIFASGDGTENNAYVIENATQLAKLAEYVNGSDAENWNGKYYKLGADIDLNNMSWTPIGSANDKPFKGNFDGAGHVIKNLNVTLTSTLKTSGLFGFIDGATIKNVGINGATVATESGLEYDGVSTNRWIAGVLIGAVVDQSTGNVISDCYIKNANMNLTITTSSSASDLTPLESAGTIVGCSYTSKASTAKVSNCYTVNATITGSNGAGGSLKVKTAATGLIGATAQKWTIENCYAADVEITGFGNIANLIRSATDNKPTITNCYTYNVTIPNWANKSYTDGTVTKVMPYVINNVQVTGADGIIDNALVGGKTVSAVNLTRYGADGNATLIVALFDGNTFINCVMNELSDSSMERFSDKDIILTNQLTLPQDIKETHNVRVFILNKTTLAPCSIMKEV